MKRDGLSPELWSVEDEIATDRMFIGVTVFDRCSRATITTRSLGHVGQFRTIAGPGTRSAILAG
jgi:hypothetical protein